MPAALAAPVPVPAVALPAAPAPFVELQRQQERERALRQQQERSVDTRRQTEPRAQARRLPADEVPCLPVERMVLVGELAERFQWALDAAAGEDGSDSPIGRCLGAEGVKIVMARLRQALAARGYVTTRVLASPQAVGQGTLTLTVIPGRIAAIRFADGSDARVSLANAIPARPGELMDLRDIEQGLENLQRVPTAQADIRLEPSKATDASPGDSDVIVAYGRRFPLRATLSLDDSGTQATGKAQAGATVAWDNPLELNDLLYVSFNRGAFNHGGRGTSAQTAHYSLPWGDWLASGTASQTLDGAGLDARSTDYAAILARAVKVNAGLWANELKVVTGANQVSADHAQAMPTTGTGAPPAFALDVAHLGGMYAGKIRLIGNEHGVGARNAGTIMAADGSGPLSARTDNAILKRADAQLYNDLAARAKIRPDTSMDAYYAANTDKTVLANNNFDMAHVLSGEINAKGKATGYHAELAADGAARIRPGATVTQNPNGTYSATVQIWDGATLSWIDKKANKGESTFFPLSWSEQRIAYEVTEAFRKGTPATNFIQTTPSGIRVQFYWDLTNQRTTFYPIGN